MLSLLRADLRRITRRHGSFFGFVIVIFAFALLTGVLPVLLRSALASLSESTGDSASTQALNEALSAPFATPTSCVASMMGTGGFLALMVCLSATHLCWVDKRNGYDRTIVSSCGKRTYYHEKMAFALVLSVIYAVVATVIALVLGGLVSGIAGMDSPLSFIGWFVTTVLTAWVCACLCMAVLWLTKNQLLVFVLAVALVNPIVFNLLGLAIGNLGEGVSGAYTKILEWMPHTAVTLASNIQDGSFTFELENLLNLVVPSVVCLGLTFLAVGALRKRDL